MTIKQSLQARRDAEQKGRENGMIYTAFIASLLYYVLG